MQREFRFRTYNHVAKTMYYPENPVDVFKWQDEGQIQTIMQFTGLKDKNGKEIYEGDIIQFKYYFVNKKWWSTVDEIPQIAASCEQ